MRTLESTIPLVGIYSTETKEIGTLMFTVSLFAMVNNWKQLRYPQQEHKHMYSGLSEQNSIEQRE